MICLINISNDIDKYKKWQKHKAAQHTEREQTKSVNNINRVCVCIEKKIFVV